MSAMSSGVPVRPNMRDGLLVYFGYPQSTRSSADRVRRDEAAKNLTVGIPHRLNFS
jgi:hypothetical protein